MTDKLSNLHGDQHIIWLASLTCPLKFPSSSFSDILAAIKMDMSFTKFVVGKDGLLSSLICLLTTASGRKTAFYLYVVVWGNGLENEAGSPRILYH